MKCILAAAAALVSSAVSAAVADNHVSTFSDVRSWVGTGANKTVVVVDFNDGSVDNCSFA